jgi:uncharacterized membrane protein (UPF0127 family)
MKMKKIISVVTLLTLGATTVSYASIDKNLNKNIKVVQIGGQNIYVDVAYSSLDQQRGLGGKQEIGANQGMLFVFDRPGKYIFWMKDMNFPIDIIWIDKNLKIVYIKKDARPELFPETYEPSVNSSYVIEVKSGFSDTFNVKTGDNVSFIYK